MKTYKCVVASGAMRYLQRDVDFVPKFDSVLSRERRAGDS